MFFMWFSMALAKSLIDFNVGKKQSEWELPPFSSCVSSSAPNINICPFYTPFPALFFYELSSVHKLFNIFNDIWRQTVNYTNNIYAFSGVGFKCYIFKSKDCWQWLSLPLFLLKTFRYAHEVTKYSFIVSSSFTYALPLILNEIPLFSTDFHPTLWFSFSPRTIFRIGLPSMPQPHHLILFQLLRTCWSSRYILCFWL